MPGDTRCTSYNASIFHAFMCRLNQISMYFHLRKKYKNVEIISAAVDPWDTAYTDIFVTNEIKVKKFLFFSIDF